MEFVAANNFTCYVSSKFCILLNYSRTSLSRKGWTLKCNTSGADRDK